MDYKQSLIKMIDTFNVKAVEEFKEMELKILADSRKIFKKNKDYDGNIEKLRRIKKNAQRINPKSVKVPDDDSDTKALVSTFQKCQIIFSGLCDEYIQFETALKFKAEGRKEENIKYKDIKDIREKMRLGTSTLNEQLNEMNMWYSDYNEMERPDEELDDLQGIKYTTYDALIADDDGE